MAKKVLPKHQITGIVKSSKTTPITMQQMQKEWNENERKATNPKNKITMQQMQKEWNENERKATNPKNKITMQQMQKEWNENERKATNPANYKKGGSTKAKKK